MRTISVAVNGASGKMGQLACESLAEDARFELVGSLGRKDDLASFLKEKRPQVVVDLTRADVVYQNTRCIIEHQAHPVIGTSGLTDAQLAELSELASRMQLGGLVVPNFSVSVLLMIHFAKKAARHINAVEIIEMHHEKKFDSPSGTAVKTAKEIASVRKAGGCSDDHGPARGAEVDDIPIHAVRLPGVLAKQSVIFGELGETLTISHESIDRRAFMPGVLLACEKVMTLNTLKYGLEQVIEGL